MKRCAACLAAILILLPSFLNGQAVSNASVSGVVTDAVGAFVPGAAITATDTETGSIRSTVSNASGSYSLSPLPAGHYKIEISKEGFTKFIQAGVVLEVGMNPEVNVKLAVGSIDQQVVVEASISQVETQQPGVGQVINQKSIEDLPLNGRQAIQLITLSGATTPAPNGDMNTNKNYPTTALSVAGGAAEGITFLLDGANHNDPFNNLNLPLPMPDALQEFKVETSALPAQYGYHSVGAVNAVTRSGTNKFHGVVFDFFRNGALNARDYFAIKRDALKRNQFGGTIGGPIIQGKLFFFAGFQGTIVRTSTTATTSNLPTPALLANGFTYGSNTVTPAQYSAPSVALLKFVPVSQVTPSAANPLVGSLIYTVPANTTEYQETARVDYVRSQKHTIFTRYFVTRYSAPQVYDGVNALLTSARAGSLDYVNAGTVGDTYVFSANLVNQFRATLNRDTTARQVQPFFSPVDLGVNMAVYEPKYTNLSVSGSLAVGGATINPGHFNTTTPQISDDFSWTWKNHQFGFGFNYIHAITNTLNTQYPNGQFSFGGTTAFTGTAIYDFLLGDINTFGQGDPQIVRGRYNYIGSYAQDLWRVTHRLTISYGLRLDPYLPTYTPNKHDMHFSQADFNNGIQSKVYVNAPVGFSFPGDSNFPIHRSSNTNAHWQDFAPRFGIAFDPRGDGKSSIRASYGIFYDLPTMFNESRFALAPPWGSTFTFNPPAGAFSNPYVAYPGGNPFPGLFNNSGPNALFPQEGAMLSMPQNVHPTYIDQYGLSLQRQIARDWLAKVEYLGNMTIHQWAYQEFDPSVYIPGTSTGAAGSCGAIPLANLPKAGAACSTSTNANARRQLFLANNTSGALVSTLANLDYFGTGSYNGLLTTVQHNMSHHFSLLANYTYSKCISDPVTHELSGDGAAYSNPANRRFDRGRCPSDFRHVANISGLFESPEAGSSETLRYLTGHWQFSPIISMRSQSFFTVTTGADTALNSISNIRANVVGPELSTVAANGSKLIQWLNPASFAAPASGTFGNPPAVYSIPGPRFLEFDTSLSRTFPVREGKESIVFRAEAFNILNRLNMNQPSASLSSGGSFGQITSDSNAQPRIMQLALKINY